MNWLTLPAIGLVFLCVKLLFDGLDPGFREGDPHDYPGRDVDV